MDIHIGKMLQFYKNETTGPVHCWFIVGDSRRGYIGPIPFQSGDGKVHDCWLTNPASPGVPFLPWLK